MLKRSEVLFSRGLHNRFYNRPLAVAVRDIFEMCNERQMRPISIDDLYRQLIEGGYRFTEEDAKGVLRRLLRRNPEYRRIKTSVGNLYQLDDTYLNRFRQKSRRGNRDHPLSFEQGQDEIEDVVAEDEPDQLADFYEIIMDSR